MPGLIMTKPFVHLLLIIPRLAGMFVLKIYIMYILGVRLVGLGVLTVEVGIILRQFVLTSELPLLLFQGQVDFLPVFKVVPSRIFRTGLFLETGLLLPTIIPFLTPSLRVPLHSSPSSVACLTTKCVDIPNVVESTVAQTATCPIQPCIAPPIDDTDLSSFPNFPSSVSTCVNVPCFDSLLLDYSQELRRFLVSGFSDGFRIGFMGVASQGRDRNNMSAVSYQRDVSAAILKELRRGHTVGPFSDSPFSVFQCSPLGAVPKKDNTMRIILDLSSPFGSSVNDGIPHEFFTVKYSSFDDAVSIVRDMGKGCFMAKIDIKHAFRLCPVNPLDWPLLGYKWLGRYFDIRLPFGLRSSPFIYNVFADAVTWILVHKFDITALIHYLDDFFVCANTKEGCQRKVDTILRVFEMLGIPVAEDKLEGPSQRLVFLGIEIDSIAMVCRLPGNKILALSKSLTHWLSRRKCTKMELLSVISSLSFACKVVKPGRIFLRRLIDLSTKVSKLHHHLDISSSVRLDFAMWSSLLRSWNGVSVFQDMPMSSLELNLFTDASFKGFGAYFNGEWLSSSWQFDTSSFHIGVLELFAVYCAIVAWGKQLRDRQIVIFSDNEANVKIWETGSSKDPNIMRLVRLLFFHCVEFNITVSLKHVAGAHNLYADLLSRLQVSRFLELCPVATVHRTQIPLSVWTFFKVD